MEKYYIESEHMVNEWSKEQGEGNNVTNYVVNSFVQANSASEAIEKYIKNILCFTYNKEGLEIGLNSKNEIQFSNIVDSDNIEDENGAYISNNLIYIYMNCVRWV